MRLSKIKLAGFKSFVDPTTIHLMSNLSAVVGPNGCGKSNVIDAVRWVMGESNAKHLRGGALTDVIFSGSSARKPVGQATVELLFDNAQGKLGGEYAQYSEIGIKRQVTRDGQSNYFLNGQRCRRKDITDIFLGTGLGPRSYAIIEQGMISRVIDAKPEDLRSFIEEAAGISKYKERRRETENRIKHTQDNLARLNDLRDELAKQLNHLQRQSQAAERYKALKSEEGELSAQLAGLAWNRLDQEIKAFEVQIRETLTQLEEKQAGFQQYKTQQEKQRIDHAAVNETLNEVQKRYYGIGGQISRIEQEIAHLLERQSQLKEDKEDAQQTLSINQLQLTQDQENIVKLQCQVSELEPLYENKQQDVEMALEIHQQAEEALEEWREKTTHLQQACMAPTQQAEAEKAKIAQLERQINQTSERQTRLEGELSQSQAQNDSSDIALLDEKIEIAQNQYDSVLEFLENHHAQKDIIVQKMNYLRPQLKDAQRTLNEMQGKQTALQALQHSALGKNEGAKNAWLQLQGLNESAYVAERLDVTQGWEIAAETVLEGFLEAVGIDSGKMLTLTENFEKLNGAAMTLIEWQAKTRESITVGSLASLVKGCELLPDNIFQLLSAIQVAQTFDEAKLMLPSLAQGQSVITREGWWLGQGWVKIKATEKNAQAGVLQRADKIKELEQQLSIHQAKLEALQFEYDECEENLKDIEHQKDESQSQKNSAQQDLVNLQSERRIKQNRFEQMQRRHAQIQQELNECKELIQNAQRDVNISRSLLQEAVENMSQLNDEKEALAKMRESLFDAVQSSRLRAKEISESGHTLALNLQTYKTQIESLSSNIERFKNQIESAKLKLSNIVLALERNEEPYELLKMDLESNLEKRIFIENDLNIARDNVAQVDNAYREIEKQLNQYEQSISHLREKLESLKMEWQAVSVRRENTLEKLQNTNYVLEDLLKNMPPEANEKEWQTRLTDVEHKIQRLGAINLAAIEEYEAAKERKEYLDSQLDDLTEALDTLENAIKKIDKETRARFQETFDKINSGFSKLFPILFGGGHAELIMTGEDLLDTGVNITARPPGKKNTSIQLLSGGEKALTAVALVFSIFQLNPAPFCMLDEVDAPLDDSNVGRFCNLVKEMSKSVQFIFISHNKLAIEMAEQLQGVTMREPGVSRLVTVDIEEAKTLVEA